MRAAASQIFEQAIASGTRSLRQDALEKVLGLGYIIGVKAGEPAVRGMADKIRVAGQDLLDMVNRILKVSRLVNEPFQTESRDFAIGPVFDAVAAQWREPAQAKALELVQQVDPDLPLSMHGDPARLEEVLSNLLGNAIKFSDHGRISLRARLVESDSGPWIRLEVEDQGIGIGPEQQGSVFDAFEQSDNSRSRKYGGLGLGLAHCRLLVELMGGEIGVRSALGQGSNFWLLLPLPGGAADQQPGSG